MRCSDCFVDVSVKLHWSGCFGALQPVSCQRGLHLLGQLTRRSCAGRSHFLGTVRGSELRLFVTITVDCL